LVVEIGMGAAFKIVFFFFEVVGGRRFERDGD
jgi:hypothetical protein